MKSPAVYPTQPLTGQQVSNTASAPAGAMVAGVAIAINPDDVPYREDGQWKAWSTTDQIAWDALDQVDGFTIQITVRLRETGKTATVELSDHGDGLHFWHHGLTRPSAMRKYVAGMKTLPKWMWRQIGYQIVDVTGQWDRHDVVAPVGMMPAPMLVSPIGPIPELVRQDREAAA